MKPTIVFLLLILSYSQFTNQRCIHDTLIKKNTIQLLIPKSTNNTQRRSQLANIRIHTQNVDSEKLPEILLNLQNRLIGITKIFYENFLKVVPVNEIMFPESARTINSCNGLKIPKKYIQNQISSQAVEADFGIIYGNALDPVYEYIVSGLPCVKYQGTGSNLYRPIWGAITFNLIHMSRYFKSASKDFQSLVYKTIHQFAHCLAFSASLYPSFINRNFMIEDSFDYSEISGQPLSGAVSQHFNCPQSNFRGFPTENFQEQRSHWEKYLVGEELMVSDFPTNPYISEFTASLFELSGWYPKVNREFIEKTTWGKDKGCDFLLMKSCATQYFDFFQQFETSCNNFSGRGIILNDALIGCPLVSDPNCNKKKECRDCGEKGVCINGRCICINEDLDTVMDDGCHN